MYDNKEHLIELVKMIKNGDNSAFSEFYELTYYPLFFNSISIVKNEEIAKDCVHDTFLSFYTHIDNISDINESLGYLFAINKTKCLNVINKEKKYANGEEDNYIETIKDTKLNPEEEALKNESNSQIRNAILSLDASKRELIILRFFNNLKIQEIAKILGKSERSVFRDIKKACSELKASLKGKIFSFTFIAPLFVKDIVKQYISNTNLIQAKAETLKIVAGTSALTATVSSTSLASIGAKKAAKEVSKNVVRNVAIGGTTTVVATAAVVAVTNFTVIFDDSYSISKEVTIGLNPTIAYVKVFDENGELYATTSDGKCTIYENGTYTFVAYNQDASSKKEKQVVISTIDREGPTLSFQNLKDGNVYLYFSDNSNIDYNSMILNKTDGNPINYSINSDGAIVYSSEIKTATLVLKDTLGNKTEFNILIQNR